MKRFRKILARAMVPIAALGALAIATGCAPASTICDTGANAQVGRGSSTSDYASSADVDTVLPAADTSYNGEGSSTSQFGDDRHYNVLDSATSGTVYKISDSGGNMANVCAVGGRITGNSRIVNGFGITGVTVQTPKSIVKHWDITESAHVQVGVYLGDTDDAVDNSYVDAYGIGVQSNNSAPTLRNAYLNVGQDTTNSGDVTEALELGGAYADGSSLFMTGSIVVLDNSVAVSGSSHSWFTSGAGTSKTSALLQNNTFVVKHENVGSDFGPKGIVSNAQNCTGNTVESFDTLSTATRNAWLAICPDTVFRTGSAAQTDYLNKAATWFNTYGS